METRRRMIIYIVASFILGAVGGAFVGSRFFAPTHEWSGRREGSSPVKEFAARLKLDERQTQAVDSILESQRAAFDTIRKSYGTAFRMQRETIRAHIQGLLNDEQRKLYEEYIKEMEDKEARRRGGGGDERTRRSH